MRLSALFIALALTSAARAEIPDGWIDQRGARDVRPGSEPRVEAELDLALRKGVARNPKGVTIEVEPAKLHGMDRFLVPVKVRLPLRDVAVEARGAHHETRLELFSKARDEGGDESTPTVLEIPIAIPAARMAEARTRHYTYSMTLLMRGGKTRCAFLVRDRRGGWTSVAYTSIDVDW